MSDTAHHLVQFFGADDRLVATVSRYLCEGLRAGDTCVVVVTEDHRDGIEAHLIAAGLDPGALSAEYRYILLDADDMLATFFDPATGLDTQRFHRDFGLLIRQASARGQPVRIFGEMVDLLVEQDQPTVAIQLEELWNELSRQHNFSLFCAYAVSAFTEDPRYRKLLHGAHSHVLPVDA
jgi:hypothetical protein